MGGVQAAESRTEHLLTRGLQAGGTAPPDSDPGRARDSPIGDAPAAGDGREVGAGAAGLEVTGQFLAFEPGLYAVDVLPGRSVATDVGLRLPCVRLEPLPASPGAGRAFVSGAAEGGWLSGGASAFVLVTGGQTRVMLTVYKAAGGMAPPELRIHPLGAAGSLDTARDSGASGAPAAVGLPGLAGRPDKAAGRDMAPAPATAGTRAPLAPAVPRTAVPAAASPGSPARVADPAPTSMPATDAAPAVDAGRAGGKARSGVVLMAHVQGVGDLFADGAGWAGRAGGGTPVEGFSVLPDGAGVEDIEYQAILGDQWNTPWTRGGGFCGSRGMALPILGFRVRLTGAAAQRLECRYWGSFVGGGEVGPLSDGAACQAGQAFLEAVRIVISPRAADAPPASSGTGGPAPDAKRRRGGVSGETGRAGGSASGLRPGPAPDADSR